MGVGDRHSKRVAAEKAKVQSSPERAFIADNREFDDAFSAWDDDDAGAQQSGPAQTAAPSGARTRIDREATPSPAGAPTAPAASGALVDPIAMHDIVISRARTLDDPLTTRVLAEIARSDETTDRGRRGPLPQRTRTLSEAVSVAPPKILAAAAAAAAAAGDRSGKRVAAPSTDTRAAESQKRPAAHTAHPFDDELAVLRPPMRRGIALNEPVRKK